MIEKYTASIHNTSARDLTSRVSKVPVVVPGHLQVSIDLESTGLDRVIQITDGKKTSVMVIHQSIDLVMQDQKIWVHVNTGSRDDVKFAGTTRAKINNMVVGLATGFKFGFDIVGVGYRVAQLDGGKRLQFNLGYSHDTIVDVPEGIDVKIEKPTEFYLSSHDKELLGQFAANVEGLRRPDSYKAKGIRRKDKTYQTKEVSKK